MENFSGMAENNIVMEDKNRLRNLGINIKSERLRRDISQEKLAELAGIGRSTLTQIEAQTSSPTLDIVEKIASALGFEPYELLIFKNLEI